MSNSALNPVVLQEEVTLDEALLLGFKTYRNGCNFSLSFKKDGSCWLQYGCYCLVNLLTGNEKLLKNFLETSLPAENFINIINHIDQPCRRIDRIVNPETIFELLKREPCKCCGGFLFESRG